MRILITSRRARRPILVHAPPDSFIATYFREHECGLVVDENDPRALARGVERILTDTDLRQKLSRNAWKRAQVDFSLAAARSKFAELFGFELDAGTEALCRPTGLNP
jgi:glycosyltransferase involved in cell wall biosynthesis